MVIRDEKITNCTALSIFLLTMSRPSQEQYDVTISMLVDGAPINAVVQHFNVHCNTISRMHTHFHHSGMFAISKEVANLVSQILRKIVIFTPCTLRNPFRNGALTSRNTPGKRRITRQTVRNTLREINSVPTSLQ